MELALRPMTDEENIKVAKTLNNKVANHIKAASKARYRLLALQKVGVNQYFCVMNIPIYSER